MFVCISNWCQRQMWHQVASKKFFVYTLQECNQWHRVVGWLGVSVVYIKISSEIGRCIIRMFTGTQVTNFPFFYLRCGYIHYRIQILGMDGISELISSHMPYK